jgi:hypothetical protein
MASTGSIDAAIDAGMIPETRPIPTEKPIPTSTLYKVIVRSKPVIIDVAVDPINIRTSPIIPPMRQRLTDSKRN